MLRIGITGGIGSGKTFICKKFEELGIPVFYADIEARMLMEKEEDIKSKIISLFGKEIYIHQQLDRKRLAQKVFGNKKAIKALNAIVHPAVKKRAEDWMQQHSNFPYTIKEAALLFESGSYQSLDKTILVHAPKDVRILRVMKRDRALKEQVLERMSHQMSDKKKMALADFIVHNDGKTDIDKIIEKLHLLFSTPYTQQNLSRSIS